MISNLLNLGHSFDALLGSHESRYFHLWILEIVAQSNLFFRNLDPFYQLPQHLLDFRWLPSIQIVLSRLDYLTHKMAGDGSWGTLPGWIEIILVRGFLMGISWSRWFGMNIMIKRTNWN